MTGTRRATAAAPIRAPVTVPRLQAAWNRDMIEWPSRRSTAAPWTFMATSQTPADTPNRNSPAATGATPDR